MRRVDFIIALCCGLLFASGLQGQTRRRPSVANPALRQELLERVKQDQAIRHELIDKGAEHPGEALLARMKALDLENTARIKAIIKRYGWPGPELVGEDGVDAAFLIVQHADHEFQKQVLPLARTAYRSHKLSGQNYALLLDRALVGDGKPQVYGTQAKPFDQWNGHEPALEPIEDEANVDKRRAEVGLPPLSEYLKMLKEFYFPKDKK